MGAVGKGSIETFFSQLIAHKVVNNSNIAILLLCFQNTHFHRQQEEQQDHQQLQRLLEEENEEWRSEKLNQRVRKDREETRNIGLIGREKRPGKR